jgi:hypothetical protein
MPQNTKLAKREGACEIGESISSLPNALKLMIGPVLLTILFTVILATLRRTNAFVTEAIIAAVHPTWPPAALAEIGKCG